MFYDNLNKTQKLLIAGAVVAFALMIGILTGYLIQWNKVDTLQNKNERIQSKLQAVEASDKEKQLQLRLASARDKLTMMHIEVLNNNLGKAQSLSTEFFNDVRRIMIQVEDQQLKQELGLILSTRDQITASLAKADPKAQASVQKLLIQLHQSTTAYQSGQKLASAS